MCGSLLQQPSEGPAGGQPSLRPRSQPFPWLPHPWRDLLSSGVPKPGARLSRRLDQRHTTSSTTINHIKPGTSRSHLKWVNGKACPTGEAGRIPSCSSLVSEGEGNIPLERTREHSHVALGPGLMFHAGPRPGPPPASQAAAAEPVSRARNPHCPVLARLTELLKQSAHSK